MELAHNNRIRKRRIRVGTTANKGTSMIFEPSKLFPCDCMGEGITVTSLEDEDDISEGEVIVSEDKVMRDCQEAPFIQLSFWEFGVCKNSRWSWWWRLKIAYHVWKEGSPYPDQVIMKAPHAKNFANHILYVISKSEKEMKLAEKQEESLSPDVKLEIDDGLFMIEKPYPMFCVQHGGSAACEESNKKNKLDCPKCKFQIDQALAAQDLEKRGKKEE